MRKTNKQIKNRQKQKTIASAYPHYNPKSILSLTPYQPNRSLSKTNQPHNNKTMLSNICKKNLYSFEKDKKNTTSDTNPTQKKEQQKITMTQPNDHELSYLYDIAIGNLFKMLDIFNRGAISEANISPQVPEKVLYFLGEAFQKIKINRKPVSFDQFKSQCLKLFRKSSDEDIREFINEMKISDNQKTENLVKDQDQSIDQAKLTIESMVQDRMIFQQGQKMNKNYNRKNRYEKMGNKNSEWTDKAEKQDRIKVWKQPLKAHIEPIKGIKYRNQRKPPKPLDQINNFQNIAENHFNHSHSKYRGVPIKEITENTHQQFAYQQNESPSFKPYQIDQSDYNCEHIMAKYRISNQRIAHDHFKRNYPPQTRDKKNRKDLVEDKLSFSDFNKFVKPHQNDRNMQESNEKLDRLSNRLEDYIKENAARLERSKNARINL